MKSHFFARFSHPCVLWGGFFLANIVIDLAGDWIIAETVILATALLASFLLPGALSLWLIILGTAGTLPVLWTLLPPSLFFAADSWLMSLLFYLFYFVLSASFARLGPILLLMLV